MTSERDWQPPLPFGTTAAVVHDSEVARPDRGRPARPVRMAHDRPHEPPADTLPSSLRSFADRWHAPDPAHAMVAAAARLREQSEQTVAPYALTPMMRVLSARRATSMDGKAHGRLHAGPQGWTVYRRTDMVWQRVRFTEAHELAHILVYRSLAANPAALDDLHRPETHPHLERLCDLGAAELLVPASDLRSDLARRPLSTVGDYNRLYDRYLVSHLTLFRRVCEASPAGTALTTWTWSEHPRGADWRIASTYANDPASAYIPTGLSRRRLTPDVVSSALAAGVANACGSLDVGSRRLDAEMTAVRPLFRSQSELPIHQGRPIRDEPAADTVYVVHRNVTTVTVRRPRFPRRKAP